jgi:glycosyltransferase domain-containing protein
VPPDRRSFERDRRAGILRLAAEIHRDVSRSAIIGRSTGAAMLIDDPAAFSLLIPTFNGTPFLTRTLDYLAYVQYRGELVLSDNSAPEHRSFVESCPRKYPGLMIKVFGYPESVRFLDKMTHTLKSLSARHVMLHAQDDFLAPEAVNSCVLWLKSHPDYSVSRGRVVVFDLERDSRPEHPGNLRPRMIPYTMRAYEQADPVERVLAHVESYASTFYSVHRRDKLIESFTYTEASTKSVVFFQYLSSAIAALQGKIHCSDQLFYVRQRHRRSWSKHRPEGADEHWPMLLVSPRYSGYYQEFRGALSALVAERLKVDADDFGGRLDAASVNLLQRSLCGIEADDSRENQFRQRISRPNSVEQMEVNRIIEFALGYPDTF